jgi:alpha-beta hydrolase superfamily lysophospholipase
MSRASVEVPTEDGLILRGERFPGSRDWVVLVHDLGEDIDAWRMLPGRLAKDGMSVLALDLRGHGGSDGLDGEGCQDTIEADTSAALAYAGSRGAERIYVIAAGHACAPAAREAANCRAFVAVAPVDRVSDWGGRPRLAIVASTSPGQQAIANSFRSSAGWAMVTHVPFTTSGLGVLRTPWGSSVVEYVAGFLKGQRLARGRAG